MTLLQTVKELTALEENGPMTVNYKILGTRTLLQTLSWCLLTRNATNLFAGKPLYFSSICLAHLSAK
jgi:hypothetical protein